MANAVRVRVELKKKYNDSYRNFKDMFQEFKRKVSNAGIMHDYKDHEYYETKSEKSRKQRREAKKRATMQDIEKKLVTGEPIKAPAGLIKKVKANLNKDKKDKKRNKKRDQRGPRHYDD